MPLIMANLLDFLQKDDHKFYIFIII